MGHMEHTAVEWREINPDYIVSSEGQVMSRKHGTGSRKKGGLYALKPRLAGAGYRIVTICGDSGQIKRYVHHLVAEAFLGPKPTPAHEINHKNGIKSDNRDVNLEWATKSQNQRHRFDVLKVNNIPRGEKAHNAVLTVEGVREIRASILRGDNLSDIAARLRINKGTIANVSAGRNWAWLDAKENA